MRKSFRKNIDWIVHESMGSFLILMLIFLFLVFFLVWANFNEIEKTVRAQGLVENTLTDKIVGHLEGGVVEKVYVKEGDKVKHGEELVTIANTLINERRNKSELKLKRLKAQLERLLAESNSKVAEFEQDAKTPEEISEAKFARSRQDALTEKLNILETQIQQAKTSISSSEKHLLNLREEEIVLKEQYDLLEPMVKRGIGSRQLLLQRKSELVKITTAMEEVYNKRDDYRLQIRELEQRKARELVDYKRDIQEEIGKVSSDLAQVREELNAANEQIVRSAVRSPIDGTIYKLSANTVGGIVRSGEAIAEIVPSGATIRIEAKVNPNDRTKIWNGMQAKVRPSRYQFSDETMLRAEIVNISAKTYFDELTRSWYYKVILKTNSEGSKKVKDFKPGMIVEVNILSGTESVLSYLLSPITRGVRGAFSEHNTR